MWYNSIFNQPTEEEEDLSKLRARRALEELLQAKSAARAIPLEEELASLIEEPSVIPDRLRTLGYFDPKADNGKRNPYLGYHIPDAVDTYDKPRMRVKEERDAADKMSQMVFDEQRNLDMSDFEEIAGRLSDREKALLEMYHRRLNNANSSQPPFWQGLSGIWDDYDPSGFWPGK